MTIERKVFLAMVVAVFLIGIGTWQLNRHLKHLKNQFNNAANTVEDLNKDVDGYGKELDKLIKELDKMIDEADATIENIRRLPAPADKVKVATYHDRGYENSLIQDIDKNKGLVLVTTIDTKMSIVIKPAAGDLEKFHVGWIAPVTFQCTKFNKGKCDFKSPYKLFVSNGSVKVKQLILPKK